MYDFGQFTKMIRCVLAACRTEGNECKKQDDVADDVCGCEHVYIIAQILKTYKCNPLSIKGYKVVHSAPITFPQFYGFPRIGGATARNSPA